MRRTMQARTFGYSSVAALWLVLMGCSDERGPGHGETLCDDKGCFVCEANASACWPVIGDPCGSDADCAAEEGCTAMGCTRRCRADSQCGEGLSCTTGLCVPTGHPGGTREGDSGAAPRASGDGAPAESADGGTGQDAHASTGPCGGDGACPFGEVCDEASGSCVPRCDTDDDCPQGEVCLACGKCQRQELPARCGGYDDYCDASMAGACGSGKQCRAGRCHFECRVGEAACPVGQICEGGVCVDDASPATPECVFDAHCDSGSCINGYCHAACTISPECGALMVCKMAICQPDYRPL